MPGSRRRHTQRCPDQPPFPRVQAAEIVRPAGAAESPDGRLSPAGPHWYNSTVAGPATSPPSRKAGAVSGAYAGRGTPGEPVETV